MKVAILADVHANIFALKAVMEELDQKNVDTILVVGDIIGYYYWPKETLDLLRSDQRVTCVKGNHEVNLITAISDKKESQRLLKKYGSGYEVCKQFLNIDDVNWIDCLPNFKIIERGGDSFYLSHGDLKTLDTYIYPDAEPKILRKNLSDCTYTIFGHTHYPLLYRHKNRILINPGSVGQPRDVGGKACYALVDQLTNEVQFCRVEFDIQKVIEAAMKYDPGLPYLQNVMKRNLI